ncbi:MAG: glycosyltransferase [Acetobacter sp.]
MRQCEGLVESNGHTLRGWVWLPHDPDSAPELRVLNAQDDTEILRFTAFAFHDAAPPGRPLARCRAIDLPGTSLPCSVRAGVVRVVGPDGRDLAGSPLSVAGAVAGAGEPGTGPAAPGCPPAGVNPVPGRGRAAQGLQKPVMQQRIARGQSRQRPISHSVSHPMSHPVSRAATGTESFSGSATGSSTGSSAGSSTGSFAGSPAGACVRTGPPAAIPPPAPVAVVVPVYADRAATLACLQSLRFALDLSHTDRTPGPAGAVRVVVVNDAAPDPDLCRAVADLCAQAGFTLIERARNGGFPAAVNTGLRAVPGHDVTVLNADTLVAGNWLAELRHVAYATARTGTVTPFSNAASIFSYPGQDGRNPVPDLARTAWLMRMAQAANAGRAVRVPTAHGFCMYLRHDCLAATGLLREDVFAQGYAEENDFCLRATAEGWWHMAAVGAFVAHGGGASFGGIGAALRQRNQMVLEQLHPGYHARIAQWCARDPLHLSRRRFDLVRLRASGPRPDGPRSGASHTSALDTSVLDTGVLQTGALYSRALHPGAPLPGDPHPDGSPSSGFPPSGQPSRAQSCNGPPSSGSSASELHPGGQPFREWSLNEQSPSEQSPSGLSPSGLFSGGASPAGPRASRLSSSGAPAVDRPPAKPAPVSDRAAACPLAESVSLPRISGVASAVSARSRVPRAAPRAVLLITHAAGGGVERVVARRAAYWHGKGARVLVLRPGARGCRLEDGAGDVSAPQYPALVFHGPADERLLARLLAAEGVGHVEIHHPAGHNAATLALPARLGCGYDVFVHDYIWLCQRVTLLGPGGHYCGEPGPEGCDACLARMGRRVAGDMTAAAYLERTRGLLLGARRVVVPSADVSARFARHFPGLAMRVQPLERDRPPRPAAPGRQAAGKGMNNTPDRNKFLPAQGFFAAQAQGHGQVRRVRVCVAGAIGLEKGYDILLRAGRDAARRNLPLEFVLVGYTPDDEKLMRTGRIFVTGPYTAADAVELIGAVGADIGLVPSIWPETWCFALGELWRAGLHVLAFDMGTPALRIRAAGGGTLVPAGLSAAKLNEILLKKVKSWQENI